VQSARTHKFVSFFVRKGAVVVSISHVELVPHVPPYGKLREVDAVVAIDIHRPDRDLDTEIPGELLDLGAREVVL